MTAERTVEECEMYKFSFKEGAERSCDRRAIRTDAVDDGEHRGGNESGEFRGGGRKAEQVVGGLAQGDADFLEDVQRRRRALADDVAEVPGSKAAAAGGGFVGQALVMQDMKD